MEAALATGMFNIGFNVSNTLAKDVFQNKDSKFQDVFSKKVDEKKGIGKEKENIKKESKDVKENEEVEKISDGKENVGETKKKDNTNNKEKVKKTKDEDNETTEKINGLVEQILSKIENTDVEDINLEDVKNLMEVKDLGLTNEELLKLQEVLEEKMMQNVIEVGPQNVETEKTTLNKYDDLEGKLEALQEKLGEVDSKVKEQDLDTNELLPEQNFEEFGSDLVSSFEEKSGLENKEGKSKEDKANLADLWKKRSFDNNLEQVDVEVGKIDNKILDVKIENISDTLMNKTANMQEQIEVIKQVSEKIDVNLFEDKSEMIIKLKPDHLGKVTVEIAVENGNITAKFLAESEKVKEILESNMQDLKDHLAKQGMVIQDLSVSVGNDDRGPLFERNNYNSFRKRKKIEEVNNEAYFVNGDYGMNEIERAIYWPDSTVSFSA